MFEDLKKPSTAVEAEVKRAYDDYCKSWDEIVSERNSWVDVWASSLAPFDATTIEHAAEYCVQNLPRTPSLPIFMTYCRYKGSWPDLVIIPTIRTAAPANPSSHVQTWPV